MRIADSNVNDRPGGERQPEVLDQDLLDDAPARRAERTADSQLALPRGRMREQQVRDVRAGNEQQRAEREGGEDKRGELLCAHGANATLDRPCGRRGPVDWKPLK